ncbi:MAG TPA: NAD-dependent succinate-semialdehyde dehydrogenase [bacterium]
MAIEAINPATGKLIKRYEELPDGRIAQAVEQADEAFAAWRRTGFPARANVLKAAAKMLRGRRDAFAVLMATEMGKPVSQGRGEIDKCAWGCEYFAEHAPGFLAARPVETDGANSYVTFAPLGVILAIMPWNFPFWQVFRCAAPGLMAGNAVLLKHAANVPGCALAIEEVFRKAGLPEGLFQTLLIGQERVAGLIEHPAVRAVTLTGSERAGRAVAAQAGAALKKTVLELGGSDPYLILEDADLEHAVEQCVASRMQNAGQSCIAAKRMIVVDAVRERFEQLLVERMRAQKVGDPLEEDVAVGPMARLDLRGLLHGQVTRSIAQGAVLRLGGTVPEGPGAFYPPTVLTGVAKGMPAYDEETFGPVASIVPVQNAGAAVRAANDTRYGLSAAVFTADRSRGEQIAAESIDAGACFVNAFVKSDPRLPFGGIKHSGYGRELSAFGIHELVNIKTVVVS